MNRIKDKVIIVTGAALGIWRASSCLLAREGAQVAVTDLQDEEGRKLVKQITKDGSRAETSPTAFSISHRMSRSLLRAVNS